MILIFLFNSSQMYFTKLFLICLQDNYTILMADAQMGVAYKIKNGGSG